MNQFLLVYRKLLSFHGPQGWWPIVNQRSFSGEYHVGAPRGEADFFEISIGAILTQNVAWKNVDAALCRLKRDGLLDPDSLLSVRADRLARLIRSTGYYNEKAKKIKNFLAWYRGHMANYAAISAMDTHALRQELLSVNGIGPETADSILLYALNRPVFVVDAYTKRIFARFGILSGGESYSEIQELFHKHVRPSVGKYNEYHALIVAHGKDFCKKRPSCEQCCIADLCIKRIA
ncbi:MAG: endonuclease [Spirochaetes bacterium]|nr:endonuclease [Spirochaetota bacterium]